MHKCKDNTIFFLMLCRFNCIYFEVLFYCLCFYIIWIHFDIFFLQFLGDEDKSERGKLLISLMYSTATSNFHVKIIRGSQLFPMDFGRKSDPYCKLTLFPLNNKDNKWSFKTTVKKNTLQPEFNEEFVFQQIQLKELINKTLQINIYDKDVAKKNDYLGKYEFFQNNFFLTMFD